jgi:hypothetical protein
VFILYATEIFTGKTLYDSLVLPANFRLDWKEIAMYKHSNLFGLIVSNEGKKFYNIDTRTQTWSTEMTEPNLGPTTWMGKRPNKVSLENLTIKQGSIYSSFLLS